MTEKDRIAEVFRNRTVFITGGTGFLGKLLIEKLLRCCDVKKIYLLVRAKKGKMPQERLSDIFSNMLFDLLKSQQPTSVKKCEIIPGDITQEGLGISLEDRQKLQEEVEFIFHSAASTRFDDTVKTAVKFNTQSTNELLNLAEKCTKLKTFVHVSTSYAFPKEKVLYEKSYKPPEDPHKVLDAVKLGQDEEIEGLIGDCPNTYTFSKALAEGLVSERMDKIPAIIVRPSVVCPVWREPLKGWCNNLQGPMGLFVGAGKGIIRSMYMKGDSYADFIPADVAINGMLTGVWNFLCNSDKHRVINVTSSSEYNLTWEEILELGKKIIYNEVPLNGAVWYPGGSTKKSRFVHNICFYLFQIVPALIIDVLLMVLGYKPILFQIQRRIQKGSEVFEYYTNKAWNFSNMKLLEISAQMSESERNRYKLEGEGIDLDDYFRNCVLSVRRNNLKETDDTLPKAKRHMKIMWFVDLCCKVLLISTILYQFVWKTYART
ncbi:fatty acyl-CoA reductase 1-like [Zophobas morio]|uniref:fatty acyl-CoA reductase 1-like n=1 Tax=Zophobas morio TaxID=2755281 RepID=UPI00308333A4